MGSLILIFAVFFVGYLISLRIHPLTKCQTCKMTGRHFGSVYTYGYRRCRTCGGSGRRDRLGTRLFFGGTDHSGIYKKLRRDDDLAGPARLGCLVRRDDVGEPVAVHRQLGELPFGQRGADVRGGFVQR